MGRPTGRLTDKVAIITGAGEGIGLGIARLFAAEGARVLIAEVLVERGEAAAAELCAAGADALFVPTDVSVEADNVAMVETALSRWGRVDILVNNAWGGGSMSRVEHKSNEAIERGMAVGFRGPLWAMQAALPTMKRQRWGRVVNICSLNGVNAHMGTLEYNCAKEALRTLSRTAAREWAPFGITVNVILPAAVTAASRQAERFMPGLLAKAAADNPMGRMGDPLDDIAPVALFLAGDDCRYVTGVTIAADGGSHINGSDWRPDLGD
jgi:NAD(P)-dependent dehydrogenase (short-subunit alcohol dehydrogenase family)